MKYQACLCRGVPCVPYALCPGGSAVQTKGMRQFRCRAAQATYPIPETEKEPSPIDIPQEWITPKPSNRPDIFPDLEQLETPMPNKLPGDPEQPEDEEWAEEQRKKPDSDPDKEPPEEGEEEEEEESSDDDDDEGDEKEGPRPQE